MYSDASAAWWLLIRRCGLQLPAKRIGEAMDAGYGQALYYPHIHLADENWLKVATLYYDSLGRIVPSGYATHDSSFVNALNARTPFIKNFTPQQEIGEIHHDFLAFAREHIANPNKRDAIWEKLGGHIPPVIAALHRDKFELELLVELSELGLATTPNDWDQEFYSLEPLTAVLYMTFLADRMAEKRGLPVVTDDPSLQPLLRDFQSDADRDPNAAFALASLVIETAIPVSLDDISVQQILDFRESSEFERLRFYEALRDLAKDIQLMEDPVALEDLLDHKEKIIRDSVAALELCYTKTRIAYITGLLSLSAPAWSAAVGAMPGFGAVPIVATATLAVGMMACQAIALNRARRESPWSYVISLRRELAKEDFLNQLQGGTILL